MSRTITDRAQGEPLLAQAGAARARRRRPTAESACKWLPPIRRCGSSAWSSIPHRRICAHCSQCRRWMRFAWGDGINFGRRHVPQPAAQACARFTFEPRPQLVYQPRLQPYRMDRRRRHHTRRAGRRYRRARPPSTAGSGSRMAAPNSTREPPNGPQSNPPTIRLFHLPAHALLLDC